MSNEMPFIVANRVNGPKIDGFLRFFVHQIQQVELMGHGGVKTAPALPADRLYPIGQLFHRHLPRRIVIGQIQLPCHGVVEQRRQAVADGVADDGQFFPLTHGAAP